MDGMHFTYSHDIIKEGFDFRFFFVFSIYIVTSSKLKVLKKTILKNDQIEFRKWN